MGACRHPTQSPPAMMAWARAASALTMLPIWNMVSKVELMPWCSMAMKIVFTTMHKVMVSSAKGSDTILKSSALSFTHVGQHSQIRYF